MNIQQDFFYVKKANKNIMPKQLVCILEINEQEGHQFKTLILLMYFTCLFETPHHTEMNFEN